MRKTGFIVVLLLLVIQSTPFLIASCTQVIKRIRVIAITPSVNTGQDYSSWMTDDMAKLVPPVWGNINLKYVDVVLTLKSKSLIDKVSLYDFEGVFKDNPAQIFALNGSKKKLIGTFTGEKYKEFVDLIPSAPILADAIIIHKYANNIPQKIQIFGTDAQNGGTDNQPVNPTALNGKISIDGSRWYQLTNASNGLEGLFDGDLQKTVSTGYGKIMNPYDSYYPVINGERMDLTGLRFYDGNGSNTEEPLIVSVITEAGTRVVIGKFTGEAYKTWVGPNNKSSTFNFPVPFNNIRAIIIQSWNFYPTEIEFYGAYQPKKKMPNVTRKTVPLKQFFGVNGFEWNFEDPSSPDKVDEKRLRAAISFTGFRHYMDWDKLEHTRGSYTFNPTFSGGWNYDELYESCKTAGIEVLACLKTVPPWLMETYPLAERDNENVPAVSGRNLSDPKSYIEQAKVGFQYAARYGNNKNVNQSLLTVSAIKRWPGAQVNVVKIGLNLVRYIECENERDKWWKGRKAYQTAHEYAANLSAFYDGNKNTMGPGCGVKNADPGMQVVMAGTASSSTGYLKGMIDWCRQHRGYNPDGSVNLCWDIINYHYYSNDSKKSQNGKATRGSAPEISGAAETAREFITISNGSGNGLPVWVTELGYDLNQASPFKAVSIGSKGPDITQADWLLRSSLLYARNGVDRIFFYEMYDDNYNSALQFSSSGLLNANFTRKPAADYFYQVSNVFGNYQFQQTISSDPFVDRYTAGEKDMFVLVVSDEKNRKANYVLQLEGVDSALLYSPKAGQDIMLCERVAVERGRLEIKVGETPVFVSPVYQALQVTNKKSSPHSRKNQERTAVSRTE